MRIDRRLAMLGLAAVALPARATAIQTREKLRLDLRPDVRWTSLRSGRLFATVVVEALVPCAVITTGSFSGDGFRISVVDPNGAQRVIAVESGSRLIGLRRLAPGFNWNIRVALPVPRLFRMSGRHYIAVNFSPPAHRDGNLVRFAGDRLLRPEDGGMASAPVLIEVA